MRIMNCTGGTIAVCIYKWRDRGFFARKTYILNNTTDDYHYGYNGIEARIIYADENIADTRYGWNNTLGYGPWNEIVDYPDSALLIITSHSGARIIEWSRVIAPYQSRYAALNIRNPEAEDIQKGIDVGYTIVVSLATGIAALGPIGALPAGIILGIGSLLLMSISGNSSVPPPPDATEIESIVARVIKRELDMQDAEKAATAFTLATSSFLRLAHKVESILKNPDQPTARLSQHVEEDIERFIHQSTDLLGEGTLLFSLKHMMRHPEMAMWILPQLVPGIGTYLAALRVHILVSAMSDNHDVEINVPIGDVAFFRDEVRSLSGDLTKVFETSKQYVEDKTSTAGLKGTLKEAEFKKLLVKSMYGLDYLDDPIQETLNELKRIDDVLTSDLNKGSTEHFWNSSNMPISK
ncbi:hypothetical protein A6E01_06580 [Vibrio breoganii]|uniref:Uncharacterized protein n=1 Tax=Vibrio breoganii TaxID=553239 RepID=A0AAN1CRU3_9VIBR|nr:hypothetical protein [Vibrio breoganii]ANO32885.1 hypothetical protein A6E01_06580 [Vibrio breoganii]